MIPDNNGPNAPEPIQHEPGIYFGLPMAAYLADSALGSGSLNDLNVSPITFWRKSKMNPEREVEETDDTANGTAVHARLLEGPEVFASRFAPALDPEDYPGVPESAKQLSAMCEVMGLAKSGTKAEMEKRIAAKDPAFVSWGALESAYGKQHYGKAFLKPDHMKRIEATAKHVAAHPDANKALTGGYPEVSIFWEDPETGIRCKARIDNLKTRSAIDLKNFSNKNGVSIDRAISSSMSRYGYHTQAVHYSEGLSIVRGMLRANPNGLVHPPKSLGGDEAIMGFVDELRSRAAPAHRFVFVFVESCAYPAIRVREFARFATDPHGNQTREETLYWKAGAANVRRALQTYDACMKAFGPNKPWVDVAPVTPFTDEEMFYAL